MNKFWTFLPCSGFRNLYALVREKDLDALTLLINGLNLRAKLAYSGGFCNRWLIDHNSEHLICPATCGKALSFLQP
jgi:hypothetical protein